MQVIKSCLWPRNAIGLLVLIELRASGMGAPSAKPRKSIWGKRGSEKEEVQGKKQLWFAVFVSFYQK